MIFKPIVPLLLMIVLTILFIVFVIKISKGKQLIIRLLIVLFLFVINLRPMVPSGEIESLYNDVDIFFVVDTTISMEAKDYDGKKRRMVGTINDVTYLINNLPGAYYSLITYDNDSYVRIPLTNDSSAILASIKTTKSPDSLYATGTTITKFKDTLKKQLENSKERGSKERIVFIFSDGENTSDEKLEDLSFLASIIGNGAVLGYGTDIGGEMVITNYYGEEEVVEDKSEYPYVNAISKIDETNLNKIAEDLNLDYIHMPNQKALDKKIKKILNTQKYGRSEKETMYKDIYYYFSTFLLALLFLELYYDRRKFA